MAKKYKKVKYEIDLIKVMERALSDRPQAVRSKLRSLMNDSLFKKKYGENIIDLIADRTENKRIDKNNKKFKAPYSKMYQKSLEFSIYGKSPNKVNLKLTGEMLASMKLGRSSSSKIKVVMADEFNNAKAHGHINGIKTKINQNAKVKSVKGKRKNPATRKIKRDFLGLPSDDEMEIMKQTIREFNSESLKLLVDFDADNLEFATASSQVETASGIVEGSTEVAVIAGANNG